MLSWILSWVVFLEEAKSGKWWRVLCFQTLLLCFVFVTVILGWKTKCFGWKSELLTGFYLHLSSGHSSRVAFKDPALEKATTTPKSCPDQSFPRLCWCKLCSMCRTLHFSLTKCTRFLSAHTSSLLSLFNWTTYLWLCLPFLKLRKSRVLSYHPCHSRKHQILSSIQP